MMRLIEQLPIVYNLVLYALNLIFFLLPGLAITLAIAVRREVRVVHAVIVTVLGSATIGYISFWIYLASKLAGQIFSFASIGVSVAMLALLLRRRTRLKILVTDMGEPFLYVLAVGIFYVCFLFLFGNGHWQFGAGLAELRFFSDLRPIDDQLPLAFAQRIYDRGPITPLWSDWLSSDRPPLQAGIFLLQKPLGFLGNMEMHYELLGTVLQCMWICGVWALMATLGASRRRTKQVLGFLVFSGFIFYNSVYAWPKLLAAAFLLFFASIVFDVLRGQRAATFFETALGAGSLSLAMLAHPGSIFSLPAFLVILIRNRRLLPVRQCVSGAILVALFAAPWMAYQKFYDPPGNRLLKLHLAGVGGIDSRSTWQALKDAYSDRDAGTYLRYKWENISTLIGPKPLDGFRRFRSSADCPARVHLERNRNCERGMDCGAGCVHQKKTAGGRALGRSGAYSGDEHDRLVCRDVRTGSNSHDAWILRGHPAAVHRAFGFFAGASADCSRFALCHSGA